MVRTNLAQLVRGSIVAVVATTMFGLGIGTVGAQADKPIASPWAMTVDVVLDSPAAAAPGAFYTSGRIQRTGPSGGAYHSWGFDPGRPGGSSVATSSFEILGEGEIIVSGVQDERMAIIGGTGDFRGATGQAVMVATGPNSFRVTFDMTGAGSGPSN